MDLNGNRVEVGREDTVCIDEDETEMVTASTMCLIGKPPRNDEEGYEPTSGLYGERDRKNLFSFQFRSTSDMNDILAREPWLFEKNIVA
ncbi:hypothetical protein ACS0TY_026186 [Phlomoides rotata]